MIKPPRPDDVPQQQKTSSGARSGNLTKPGVNALFVQPSANKGVRGRILPCFNFDIDAADPKFKTAWSPYRDKSAIDPDDAEAHAPWNQWYFPFEMYSFFGPNKRSFLSPRVRARLGLSDVAEECYDPISRMGYLIAKDDKWKHLGHLTASNFNAPPGTPPPAMSRSRGMVFMNFYGTFGDRDEDQNFVLVIPEGGMDFIKGQLNKVRKSSVRLLDPNWPDYLFGDVTNPQTGLLAWSTQKAVFGDKTANTLTFSKNDDSIADVEVMPVSDEVLAARVNYFDTTNTLHIPTPQEVLDWVIDDGMVPLEFIRYAVGKYLNVPSEAPVRKVEAPVQAPAAYRNPAVTTPPVPADDPEDDIPFTKDPGKDSSTVASTTPASVPGLSAEQIQMLSGGNGIDKEQYQAILNSLAGYRAS